MLVYTSFPLIWYATWPHSDFILSFMTLPTGWRCVLVKNMCLHGAPSSIPFNLVCSMTTFRKIYGLTFWPHPLGQGCVCGQNICYHVAANIVSFNLKFSMTIFWKSLILTLAPPPKSTSGTLTHAFKLKSLLICFISIAALPACKVSAKNIDNCLSYCEI